MEHNQLEKAVEWYRTSLTEPLNGAQQVREGR